MFPTSNKYDLGLISESMLKHFSIKITSFVMPYNLEKYCYGPMFCFVLFLSNLGQWNSCVKVDTCHRYLSKPTDYRTLSKCESKCKLWTSVNTISILIYQL